MNWKINRLNVCYDLRLGSIECWLQCNACEPKFDHSDIQSYEQSRTNKRVFKSTKLLNKLLFSLKVQSITVKYLSASGLMLKIFYFNSNQKVFFIWRNSWRAQMIVNYREIAEKFMFGHRCRGANTHQFTRFSIGLIEILKQNL